MEERILKAIKFFRTYIKAERYDSVPFKKYWPQFLDLVEEFITGQPKLGGIDTIKEAEKIFGQKSEQVTSIKED